MVIDKLPFDKYELEPSPLTQYILERKSPHTCWQVPILTYYPNVYTHSGIWELVINWGGGGSREITQ